MRNTSMQKYIFYTKPPLFVFIFNYYYTICYILL
nr:MAG TPA: hypothetical protein [Caudoviricetes sp.]